MSRGMSLQTWYQMSLGQDLLREEQVQLAKWLPKFFGYHLLQLGLPLHREWLAASPISHRFSLGEGWLDYEGCSACSQSFCQLPLQADSLDVVLLAHALEYTVNPQAVLEEVYRTLIPGGYLIILAFNPISTWGLCGLFKSKRNAPWSANFITTGSLRTWLQQQDFSIIEEQGIQFQLPLRSVNTRKKFGFIARLGARFWPSCGATSMIIAKKEVARVTPLRAPWRAKKRFLRDEAIEQQPQSRAGGGQR